MDLALYDPALGYYRRDRHRVGRDRGADFYTATSLGPLFGELVCAAAAKLLRDASLDPATHSFVEIGAEPTGGIVAGLAAHPFTATRTIHLNEPIHLDGPCVVFSNELFDARPVRRFIHRGHGWHEQGVRLVYETDDGDGLANLTEVDLGAAPPDASGFLPPHSTTPEGYRFDAPLAAAELAHEIAQQRWTGLFLAFDYGKSFAELAHAVPAGTARAYHQHTATKDLLARPGEQDLTAHVCWDWLTDALTRGGAARATALASQESFFVHHAGEFIAAQLAAPSPATHSGRGPLDPRRRALMHLLHPGQMGQKFQVLHGLKT
ncbi:MAG: hypothetical protein EAZ36_05170 [Verrucomicrobia bacterium]|nr:MAG: hypothetical protein EAZ36_05170 [Verrucomicrobiota bacterium]